MNMREKIARAIAVAELGDKDQSAIELFWPRFEKHVDAILDAMREPSGQDITYTGVEVFARHDPRGDTDFDTVVDIFHTMIDAIKAGK